MLVGPSLRPRLPVLPEEGGGIRGIIQYIRELDSTLATNLGSIVANTVALLGIRGIASNGTTPNNFVQQLSIGNVCSISWTFSVAEFDRSYMLFMDTFPTLLGVAATLTTSRIDFTFGGQVPSGCIMNVLLLR